MKKFIVDFEGEEDYAPVKPDHVEDAPEYIIYWWDDRTSAETDCKDLVREGHPAWMIKYTFAEPRAVRTGWGTGVNTDAAGFDYRIEYENVRYGTRYYNISIVKRPNLVMARLCWKYEEIVSKLKFFEAIPYEEIHR